MATSMTLAYDASDTRATTMLNLLLASGLFTEQTQKCGMEEAMDDIREGRVYTMSSIEDFMATI